MKLRVRIGGVDAGVASTTEASAAVVRLGRSPLCEIAVDPVAYPKVSGEHARIEEAKGGFVLVHLSRSNKTLLNDKPVEKPAPVRTGDKIRLGYTGPVVEVLLLEPTPAAAGPGFGATVAADEHHIALLRGSARIEAFAIGAGGVIGRGGSGVQFQLNHPHVSRRHARLSVTRDGVTLRDLGSANGTYVNGRRASRAVALETGDRIDIGPFSLEFDGRSLVGISRANNVELVARNVRRVVSDHATGDTLTLLDDINLVVRPGEFACLIGPSGSGKSTLLSALSGRITPEEGSVTLNGRDLHAEFGVLKQDVAVVPQRDLLHDTLSVGQALSFTAELRLPPDTEPADIAAAVDDILGVVGLSHRRGTMIRNLSGGQIKRTSLANELLCKPSLLFLDEVTSGLDEQTDREMMELFRVIAGSGKTVVCVTHSLANVEATCHLVVILAEGGRLAFVGSAEEARSYFRIARLGDVYRKLAERSGEEWQAAFHASPFYARYVRDRMPRESSAAVAREAVEERDAVPVAPVRQWQVLTRRYVSVLRGDVPALLAFLTQSLLVGLLLAGVFGPLARIGDPAARGPRTVNLLFLLTVASFWFGCNNAAKELVRERAIFARERDFNLRVDSYLASKFTVLAAIGLIQVALLFGLVRVWCGPPGNALGQWAVLALLVIAGTTTGLLISALARTEAVAVALIPVGVIPQIILAGVVAPLSGAALTTARVAITAYSGQSSLEGLIPPSEATAFGIAPRSPLASAAVIGGHVVIGTLLALLILRTRRSAE